MARSDSGDSSGASLTSDEEGFGSLPQGQSPTYRTQAPPLPAPQRTSLDAPSAKGAAPRMSSETRRAYHAGQLPPLGPAARRFKAVALKVINTHRTARVGVGAEPGVDPRNPVSHQLYGHLTQLCTIDVVDYSAVTARFKRFDNAGLREWWKSPDHVRPQWARVRWIHVTAISWDILSLLALEYEMHPLALEDVIHSRASSRSKASYYSQQLFLRVLCHTLAEDAVALHTPSALTRSESPTEMLDEKTAADPDATLGKNSRPAAGKRGTLPRPTPSRQSTRHTLGQERWQNPDTDVDRRARQAKLDVLKEQDHRVLVNLDNLFIFLWRDGTVITIHSDPGSSLFDPIKDRLRSRDTILRQTVDPSLLVESLLDLVVDEALDIVDKYQDKITKLESSILSRAKMRLVRALHIISGDLALLKRSLDPIKSLVFGLRRYDLDRCIAVAASQEATEAAKDASKDPKALKDAPKDSKDQKDPKDPNALKDAPKDSKDQKDPKDSKDSKDSNDPKEHPPVVGFMSHKSKIYLADVYDHIEYVLSSMDLFATQAENLISFTFNMSSAETNETMRRLTLITIICLPLTLLTGYFGMNFDRMWSVQQNSDFFFWKIALPMMAVLIPLFTWSDIVRGLHKVQKKVMARAVAQEIRGVQPRRKRGNRDHHAV